MVAKTEVIRNVWDEEEGVFLSVIPSSERWITIQATGKKNRGYYGDIELPLPKAFAKALGQALIDAANGS